MTLVSRLRRALPLGALFLVSCAGTVRCDPTPSYSVVPMEPDPFGGLGGLRPFDGAVPFPVPAPCGEEPCAAERVVAGPLHTCAVVRGIESGTPHLYCWGNNDASQASLVTGNRVASPTRFAPVLDEVLALSLGRWHTCFVAADQLTCFGANARGVLGSTVPAQGFTLLALPDQIADSSVLSITSGIAHLCASGAGEVRCRGDDSEGQLGFPTESGSFSVTPVQPEYSGVRAAASSRATCVEEDRLVRCWGRLEGRPPIAPGELEVPGAFLLPASVGPGHVCVIRVTADGLRVECFGRNDDGELGRGSVGGWWDEPGPVDGLSEVLGEAALESLHGLAAGGYVEATLHTVADVEVGDVVAAHTCAMGLAAVACWGSGEAGQLGHGRLEGSSRPVLVSGLPAPPSALSLGGLHSCALLSGGLVACWGDNSHGQIGVDPSELPRSATPVIVPWITGVGGI